MIAPLADSVFRKVTVKSPFFNFLILNGEIVGNTVVPLAFVDEEARLYTCRELECPRELSVPPLAQLSDILLSAEALRFPLWTLIGTSPS